MDGDSDPYAELSRLCGIAAFSLPPRPRNLHLLAPQPSADYRTEGLFGPIPDHLLPRYLCYDDPPPSPSTTIPHPDPLLVDSPSPCPCETLLTESCNPGSPAPDSLTHQREILPPCVVNYQDSLTWTPERDSSGVGLSDYENCETDEMALPHPNGAAVLGEHLVSGDGKRLLSLMKKWALWHEDLILDDKKDEVCSRTSFRKFEFSGKHEAKSAFGSQRLALWSEDVNFIRSFRNFAFSPSRKKQRKYEEGVASSFHFTRSKSANR